MTAKSRNKGAAYEREVAKALLDLTGLTFARNLEQVRAVELGDLLTDEPAWPFTVECKRRAEGRGALTAWKTQAAAAARKAAKHPAVVFRFDGQQTRVLITLEAIGHAFGGAPGDCEEWAEITLEGLAYLAREIMAKGAT